MSNFYKIGINRSELINGLNNTFQTLEDNEHTKGLNVDRLRIEQFLETKRAYRLGKESLEDETYVYYVINTIEKEFFPFILLYRHAFVFEAVHTAWIKITDSELDLLVPENWEYSNGLTFREYFKSIEEIEGQQYATVGCWSNYPLKSGLPESDIDFWQCYDFFGSEKIILDSEFRKLV